MDTQILGALIVSGSAILLSLLGLLWQGARTVERLKSIQYAAKVRQEATDRRWLIHEDRHSRMEIRLDRMERSLQDRR